MSNISVIIPVYHALDELKACLKSLEKVRNLNQAEVILVNDCPGSETADFLRNYAEKHSVVLLNNHQNMGFIKSCNRAVGLAKSPIVVLLNSDTEVPTTFLDKFIECFDSNPQIACAAPLGGNSFERKAFPADVNKADALAESVAGEKKYIKTLVPHGFCLGLRRSAIEKIGLFDEIFGKGYCEENDLACRALKAGYINVVMVNTYVLHKEGASFGTDEKMRRIMHNRKILNERWQNFLSVYKKNNPDIFKAKKYLQKVYPWYYNVYLKLRTVLFSFLLCLCPKNSILSEKLRRLK